MSQAGDAPALVVRLSRLSANQRRFEYRRPDGSGETIELENEETLRHDLLHFVVETEAALNGSFYGLLARIGGYGELSVAGGAALGGEIAVTERVVGALTGALDDEPPDVEAFASAVAEHRDLYGERPPAWLTPAFMLAVRRRVRELQARWRSTAPGETMELRFPLRR